MQSLWNLLPHFDGQTIVTFVFGLAATLITFSVAYRKTIGASDERVRAACADLCNSVIRRVAVDRQHITNEQFEALRRAKAYQAQVPVSKLVDYDTALSMTLLQTIENNFLDLASKNAIIENIGKPQISPSVEPASMDVDLPRKISLVSIFVASVLVGLVSSLGVYEDAGFLHDQIIDKPFSFILRLLTTGAISIGVAVIFWTYILQKTINLISAPWKRKYPNH